MANGSLLNNNRTIFWRFMSLLNYQNLGKTSHGSTGSWNADAGGSRDYITAGKNWNHKKKSCKTARETYKRFHQDTNTLLNKARNQYINNILSGGLENKSHKPFGRFIKSQRTESTGVAPLKEAGLIHSDPKKKASILAQQFRSVFTQDDEKSAATSLNGPSYPPMADITIGEAGVAKFLKGVDPSKASGPDQKPCKLLRELHIELAQYLPVFFRHPTTLVPCPLLGNLHGSRRCIRKVTSVWHQIIVLLVLLAYHASYWNTYCAHRSGTT